MTDEQLAAKLAVDIPMPPADIDPTIAFIGILMVDEMVSSLDREYAGSIRYLTNVKAELENRLGGDADE
jgi:hypothetical protein